MVEIKVENLKLYNSIILIISTVTFVASSVITNIFYIRYLLVSIGAILLFFSYIITALDYYRQLFTAYPQYHAWHKLILFKSTNRNFPIHT